MPVDEGEKRGVGGWGGVVTLVWHSARISPKMTSHSPAMSITDTI